MNDLLDGTDLEFGGRGPRLSDLDHFFQGKSLPEAPFSVSGAVRTADGQVHVSEGRFSLADHRAAFDGVVVPIPELVDSHLSFELEGPGLGELGRLAAGITELPELPAEPYAIRGDVAVHPSGYELRSLHATLGPAEALIEGRLGTAAKLRGSDLSIDLHGPDASLFTALTGVTLPAAPFDVQGRVTRGARGMTFHDLRLRLGEYRAHAEGSLGEAPRFVGSDLVVEARGPSLELVEKLTGTTNLPDLPFELSGSASGSPERFQIDDLDLRVGDSDLSGFLRLDLADRPRLEVRLQSDQLDTVPWRRTLGEVTETSAEGQANTRDEGGQRLLPDRSFELSGLTALDVKIDWIVAELRLPVGEILDINLALALEDGRLQLGPFEATGSHGGRLQGQVRLEPSDESFDLDAQLTLDKGWFDLTAGTTADANHLTSIGSVVDLHARGRTARELAASASGRLIVSLDGGEIDSSIIAFISADLVVTIINTVNPFVGADQATVGLDCAVIVAQLDDGIALLEPMAVKTETVTILGRGAIDLATEEIDFEWVTKPRKGLGISASTLTNPYVKLSGTLTEPRIDVKPVEAIGTTGVAVATGGVSLLGKGLWDRVTAERKVCKKCLDEAKRRLEGKKPRRRSLLFQ
jgi:hypothetical protein